MLTRPRHLIALAALLAVVVVAPAAAASQVDCPVDREWCTVTIDAPGTGDAASGNPLPNPTGAAGARTCAVPRTGVVVPCWDETWGWFSNSDGCYYTAVDPQPPPEHSSWLGNHPAGAVYVVTCIDRLGGPGTNGGWTWLASPPEGFGTPTVSPGELAQQAVDQMQLVGPEIRLTGAPGQPYVIGVPLWLWTEVTPRTWGPATATAAVPGLSVTATAQATRIVWDMGDGNQVTCANPGTAYYRGAPLESPTCDYTYSRTSAGQPGDAWTITATATWEVAWAGGGTSGVLSVTRTAQTSLQVGEVQVLIIG